jgi:acetyl-CoA acetyltransferase
MTGAVITGVGRTPAYRHTDRPALGLAVDAALAAIADAGLATADVDGVAVYPGGDPSPLELRELLGLSLRWYDGGSEGPAQLRGLTSAVMAVVSGAAEHVLVVRAVDRLPGSFAAAPAGGVRRDLDLLQRIGLDSAVGLFALHARRLFHDHGITRRELGSVVLAARAAAAENELALIREPLSLDEYLGEAPLAAPLGRSDCDRLCAGAVAVVVSHGTRAAQVERAVAIEAWSGAVGSGSLLHAPRMAMWDCADDLWRRSRHRPADVGVWCLYDGFSSLAAEWLAALGVAGGAGLRDLLDGPEALRRTGPVPLNPDGGMLTGGRLHGLNYVHEACVQLRAEAGARQVTPLPEVAVVAAGGGPVAGAIVLNRDAPR